MVDSPAPAAPAEGWLTFLLHILVLAITANSVVRIDQGGRSNVLVPLAVGGLILGCLVARTPALDAFSHILAFVSGAAASLLLCTLRIDGFGETWRRHGGNVVDLARRLV